MSGARFSRPEASKPVLALSFLASDQTESYLSSNFYLVAVDEHDSVLPGARGEEWYTLYGDRSNSSSSSRHRKQDIRHNT